jgi:hypothetical protein
VGVAFTQDPLAADRMLSERLGASMETPSPGGFHDHGFHDGGFRNRGFHGRDFRYNRFKRDLAFNPYDYYNDFAYYNYGYSYEYSYYDSGSSYVISRRLHTTSGWRTRPIQVCG